MSEYLSPPWYCLFDDPEVSDIDIDSVVDDVDPLTPIHIEECRVVKRHWVVATQSEENGTERHLFDTREAAENFCVEQREKIEDLAT